METEEMGGQYRINGGRFYQQHRMVRGTRYGPYWYCRSGWGKVQHLGQRLPTAVEAAIDVQQRAGDLLRRLERLRGALRRFVDGRVLDDSDLRLLATLGFTLPDDVLAMTQALCNQLQALRDKETPEVLENRRAIAQEVLSEDERRLLAAIGFEWAR